MPGPSFVRAALASGLLAALACAGGPPPEDGTCSPPGVFEYVACGCGCCGGAEPAMVCVEETGRCLGEIIAEDEAARASPGCSFAGCAAGTKYVVCADRT